MSAQRPFNLYNKTNHIEIDFGSNLQHQFAKGSYDVTISDPGGLDSVAMVRVILRKAGEISDILELDYRYASSPAFASAEELKDQLDAWNIPANKIADADGNQIELAYNNHDDKYELPVTLRGHVCGENTTSTPLAGGGVFLGDWQDTLDYGMLIVSIITDQDSAVDGLELQFSRDGVNQIVGAGDKYTISANAPKTFSAQPSWQYFRVKYTNGAVAQSTLELCTTLKRTYAKPSSHRIQDTLKDEDDGELMVSVNKLRTAQDDYVSMAATQSGNAKISLEELESGVSEDNNSTLRTTTLVQDEYGNVTRILGDNIFKGALAVIDVEHHEIHCGDSYECSYLTTLGNGGVLNILIVVPNEGLPIEEPGLSQDIKQYHLKGKIATEFESTVQFFEAATVSANGTAIDVFNRNRNAPAATYNDFLGIFHTPTILTDGNQLQVAKIGSARSYGGESDRSNEWVLKDNTIYLLRITNDITNDNWVNVELDYYVHPGV